MQTTLLGLALAFIVALLAALIGPHFVDWNQFRPQFETEASRVLGAPVRVNGTLDARLLPTPTLHLRSVAVGGANDPRGLSAEKLDVEFSLSAAMRGEWRASELSLEGLALNFGLDRQGRIEGPFFDGRFNLGSLTIDRLNLAGRIGLHDSASGASLQLDAFKFNGDVRALAGTMRGEGSFNLASVRIPFRVSSGHSSAFIARQDDWLSSISAIQSRNARASVLLVMFGTSVPVGRDNLPAGSRDPLSPRSCPSTTSCSARK